MIPLSSYRLSHICSILCSVTLWEPQHFVESLADIAQVPFLVHSDIILALSLLLKSVATPVTVGRHPLQIFDALLGCKNIQKRRISPHGGSMSLKEYSLADVGGHFRRQCQLPALLWQASHFA